MPRSCKSPCAKPALLLTLGLLTLAGGCGYLADGNPLVSRNEFNLPSTSTLPQTLVLRDLRTDEVLFTWEIPVNQKLFVKIYPQRAEPLTEASPDQCEWLYYPIALKNPPAENRVRFNVPPADSRRFDLFVRPTPELPADMKPSDVPTPPDDLPPVK